MTGIANYIFDDDLNFQKKHEHINFNKEENYKLEKPYENEAVILDMSCVCKSYNRPNFIIGMQVINLFAFDRNLYKGEYHEEESKSNINPSWLIRADLTNEGGYTQKNTKKYSVKIN